MKKIKNKNTIIIMAIAVIGIVGTGMASAVITNTTDISNNIPPNFDMPNVDALTENGMNSNLTNLIATDSKITSEASSCINSMSNMVDAKINGNESRNVNIGNCGQVPMFQNMITNINDIFNVLEENNVSVNPVNIVTKSPTETLTVHNNTNVNNSNNSNNTNRSNITTGNTSTLTAGNTSTLTAGNNTNKTNKINTRNNTNINTNLKNINPATPLQNISNNIPSNITIPSNTTGIPLNSTNMTNGTSFSDTSHNSKNSNTASVNDGIATAGREG